MGIKLNKFKKALEQKMQETLKEATSKVILNEVKDMVVKDIKTRVTLGYGVKKTGGSKQKLDRLAPSYVDQRKSLKKKGKLSTNTSAKRSNLHQSGQMIDKDLDGIVQTSTNKQKITIGFKTDRSSKIAAFVEKKRPFLNLSRGEVKRVVDFFRRQISEIFRKKIKNLR